MDNVKDDAYYEARLLRDLRCIAARMAGVTEQDFAQEEILQDAMMFRLIQVSENARKLSEPYRAAHTQIPWFSVFGLRNRIVHDYGAVDLHIVYTTLTKDVPALIVLIEGQT